MSSPIDDTALEAVAADVAQRLRVVHKRAPREIRRRVRETLEAVFRAVEEGAEIAQRLTLARRLESLSHELRGRKGWDAQLYTDGKLGCIRVFDPVRIRGVISPRRVHAHFERYEARLLKSERRLRWFFMRAGLEVEAAAELAPWEQPYANMVEGHELLWGRIQRQ